MYFYPVFGRRAHGVLGKRNFRAQERIESSNIVLTHIFSFILEIFVITMFVLKNVFPSYCQ